MARESSFSAGFGGAFGVMLAVAVVFVGLPILGMFLLCGGCVALTGSAGSVAARLEEEERARKAAEVSTGTNSVVPPVATVATSSDGDPAPAPAPPEPSKVTLANFQRIAKDMTKEEVFEILGKPDELTAHSVVGKGTSFETTSETYLWRNDLATCTISFRGGKVTLMSEIGLE